MEPILILLVVFVAVCLAVVHMIAMWRIFEKCGWSGALSLLLLIPLVNLVILLMVAFSESPSRRPSYQYAPPPPPPPAG